MFGGEKFHEWKLKMSYHLKRIGQWKLVIGEDAKPTRGDSTMNALRIIQGRESGKLELMRVPMLLLLMLL